MSNWRESKLTIKHKYPLIIERIVNAFDRGELFDEFIPCPKELLKHESPMRNKRTARRLTAKYGADCWDIWRIINWGTTRDLRCGDGYELVRLNLTSVKLTTMTDWYPPVHVLDHWVDLGCDVRGSFLDEWHEQRVIYRNKRIWEGGVEVDRLKTSERIERFSKGDPFILSHVKQAYPTNRLRSQCCVERQRSVDHLKVEYMLLFATFLHEKRLVMAQASVLTDIEIRRVFRIIETTRHAARNRLAFVLSIYAGLRVGEIAALTIHDVATIEGNARREIKLGAHQTKGAKGRTVVLSNRVREELASFLKSRDHKIGDKPLVASQRNGRQFTPISLSMLFKEIYEMVGIRTSSHSGRRTFATRLNASGVGMKTIQKLMGHRHIGTTALYCEVNEETLRRAVDLL